MTLHNITANTLSDIDQKSISLIGSFAILWLVVPYLIFIVLFYKWYLVLPTLGILAYFIKPVTTNLLHQAIRIPKSYLSAALFSAVFFVWFSGLIPPLGMAADWEKHFALMNFMAESKISPPLVLKTDGYYFLRYNVALYLLPVLFDNLGIIGLRYWIAVYEIIGLFLFFLLLGFITLPSLNHHKHQYLKILFCCLIFMGFSGLDIIGSFYGGNGIDFSVSIEWWAWLSSFSSMKTQLDFTPQHCLPAWIGVALLYLNARQHGQILKENLFLLLTMIFFFGLPWYF